MAAPVLQCASFPKLKGSGNSDPGIVTGTGLATGYAVTIKASGNRTWTGKVGTRTAGDTWTVIDVVKTTFRADDGEAKSGKGPPAGEDAPMPRGVGETSVTVTNNGSEESNRVVILSDLP